MNIEKVQTINVFNIRTKTQNEGDFSIFSPFSIVSLNLYFRIVPVLRIWKYTVGSIAIPKIEKNFPGPSGNCPSLKMIQQKIVIKEAIRTSYHFDISISLFFSEA